MKNFLCLSLLFSMNLFAAECPVDFGDELFQEKVIKAIESKKNCSQASSIAEACAMGSAMDASFVSSAQKQCLKRINRSTSAKKAVDVANDLCFKKYENVEGSYAISARAFCSLEVSKLFDNLLQPADI